ncbi:hypothetical protein LG293_16525 (plasmid) [Citricoccus nitrophenolicus]
MAVEEVNTFGFGNPKGAQLLSRRLPAHIEVRCECNTARAPHISCGPKEVFMAGHRRSRELCRPDDIPEDYYFDPISWTPSRGLHRVSAPHERLALEVAPADDPYEGNPRLSDSTIDGMLAYGLGQGAPFGDIFDTYRHPATCLAESLTIVEGVSADMIARLGRVTAVTFWDGTASGYVPLIREMCGVITRLLPGGNDWHGSLVRCAAGEETNADRGMAAKWNGDPLDDPFGSAASALIADVLGCEKFGYYSGGLSRLGPALQMDADFTAVDDLVQVMERFADIRG